MTAFGVAMIRSSGLWRRKRIPQEPTGHWWHRADTAQSACCSQCVQRPVDMGPQVTQARIMLARIQAATGDRDAVRETLEQAVASNPTDQVLELRLSLVRVTGRCVPRDGNSCRRNGLNSPILDLRLGGKRRKTTPGISPVRATYIFLGAAARGKVAA